MKSVRKWLNSFKPVSRSNYKNFLVNPNLYSTKGSDLSAFYIGYFCYMLILSRRRGRQHFCKPLPYLVSVYYTASQHNNKSNHRIQAALEYCTLLFIPNKPNQGSNEDIHPLDRTHPRQTTQVDKIKQSKYWYQSDL